MIGRAEYSCGFSAVQEVYHYLFVLSLQQECNSIRPIQLDHKLTTHQFMELFQGK